MKGVCKGKEAFILTCIVLIIAIAVHDYCSYVEQQEKLQAANKCENIYINFCFVKLYIVVVISVFSIS